MRWWAAPRVPVPAARREPASGSGHHAVVDAVRAMCRLEPRVAAQVVGRAADVGCGAAGRHRGIDRAHRIRSVGAASGVARGVGIRRGGVRVG